MYVIYQRCPLLHVERMVNAEMSVGMYNRVSFDRRDPTLPWLLPVNLRFWICNHTALRPSSLRIKDRVNHGSQDLSARK